MRICTPDFSHQAQVVQIQKDSTDERFFSGIYGIFQPRKEIHASTIYKCIIFTCTFDISVQLQQPHPTATLNGSVWVAVYVSKKHVLQGLLPLPLIQWPEAKMGRF